MSEIMEKNDRSFLAYTVCCFSICLECKTVSYFKKAEEVPFRLWLLLEYFLWETLHNEIFMHQKVKLHNVVEFQAFQRVLCLCWDSGMH